MKDKVHQLLNKNILRVFKVRDRCTWIRLVRPNLFPQVGVGRFEQLLHLPSQVATHLGGAHAAQRAQGQALDVLCAVVQVTVDERGQDEQVTAVNTDGEDLAWEGRDEEGEGSGVRKTDSDRMWTGVKSWRLNSWAGRFGG